jgi:YidC/Oxa1 family membrane protein insertase
MEKRIFYAFLISILFFIVYSYFVSKIVPPQPLQQITPERKVEKEENAQPPLLPTETEELPQVKVENLFITYSPTGGYLSKMSIINYGEELLFRNIGYISQDKDEKFIPRVEGNKIVFVSSSGKRKEFIFDHYILKIKLTEPSPLLLFSNLQAQGVWDARYQEIFYFKNNVFHRKPLRKISKDTYNKVEFAGARDRYYTISLLKGSYDIEWKKDKKEVHLYLNTPRKEVSLYIGPQIEKELKPFGLQGIIYYGFFHGIGVGMIKLLHFFYFLTKNWGISITLFAILIYFILFPFTAKSTKAMKRMQQIQPEIEELKKKYGDNPHKLNKETLELYKKYKINPLGGCLPLFFQFPIFISLYQVLLRFVELKGASFLWIKDLSLPDRAIVLPFSLPFLGKAINLLPIFIVILGLIQQKITTVTSSASSQQKSMGLFFSVFIGVIFYNFPSCLVLYWFIQNLLTLIYQWRLNKTS